MDRKDFFRHSWRMLLGKSVEKVLNHPLIKTIENLATPAAMTQRPPGALEEAEFEKRCSGCDQCMIACPVNVIMIEDLEKRFPLIYPEKNPCIQCADYPCIAACPTGALHLNNGTGLKNIS